MHAQPPTQKSAVPSACNTQHCVLRMYINVLRKTKDYPGILSLIPKTSIRTLRSEIELEKKHECIHEFVYISVYLLDSTDVAAVVDDDELYRVKN